MPVVLLGLCAAPLFAAPPAAVDYGKLGRGIRKEPAYTSKALGYALLLFGPEAKVKVWTVLDGEMVYLDRNGDGDLTGKDERFAKAGDVKDVEIRDPDGKTRYVITGASLHKADKPGRFELIASVSIKGPVEYDQYADVVEMRADPNKAMVAHFHGPLAAGPLTINWKVPPGVALRAGGAAADVRLVVGTMSAEHGCWVVVRSHKGNDPAFPKGVRPAVDVEFPNKTPGGPPVKRRYVLDKFC